MVTLALILSDFEALPSPSDVVKYKSNVSFELDDEVMHGGHSLKMSFSLNAEDSCLDLIVNLSPSVDLQEGEAILLWVKGAPGCKATLGLRIEESDGDSYLHWLKNAVDFSGWKVFVAPLRYKSGDFYTVVYKSFTANPWDEEMGDKVFLSSPVSKIAITLSSEGSSCSGSLNFDYMIVRSVPRFVFPGNDTSIPEDSFDGKLMVDVGLPLDASSLDGKVFLMEEKNGTSVSVSVSVSYVQKEGDIVGDGIIVVEVSSLEEGNYSLVLSPLIRFSDQVLSSAGPFPDGFEVNFSVGGTASGLSFSTGDIYWVLRGESLSLKSLWEGAQLSSIAPPSGSFVACSLSGSSHAEAEVLSMSESVGSVFKKTSGDSSSWIPIAVYPDGVDIARFGVTVEGETFIVLSSAQAKSASMKGTLSRRVVRSGDSVELNFVSPIEGTLRVYLFASGGVSKKELLKEGIFQGDNSVTLALPRTIPDGIYTVYAEVLPLEGGTLAYRVVLPIAIVNTNK